MAPRTAIDGGYRLPGIVISALYEGNILILRIQSIPDLRRSCSTGLVVHEPPLGRVVFDELEKGTTP
jgi:hypothetical protein